MKPVSPLKSCGFGSAREAFFPACEPVQRLGEQGSVASPQAPLFPSLHSVVLGNSGLLLVWEMLGEPWFVGPSGMEARAWNPWFACRCCSQ